MTDHSIARDYWQRPYVSMDGPLRYEKGKKTPVNATAYTRISTLAGALDSGEGLFGYHACYAAMGVVKEKSLYARVAAMLAKTRAPYYDKRYKSDLKSVVESAQKSAGIEEAAELGTAFHALTEVVDEGGWPEFVPTDFEPWLHAYADAMSGWERILIEPFVVNDELKVAGNPDGFWRHRASGMVLAGDIKTGTDEPEYASKVTTQVAIAANSVLYDQPTGERTHIECSKTKGLLVHVPVRTETPKCDLYVLDLEAGWERAKLASKARSSKIGKPKKWSDADVG